MFCFVPPFSFVPFFVFSFACWFVHWIAYKRDFLLQHWSRQFSQIANWLIFIHSEENDTYLYVSEVWVASICFPLKCLFKERMPLLPLPTHNHRCRHHFRCCYCYTVSWQCSESFVYCVYPLLCETIVHHVSMLYHIISKVNSTIHNSQQRQKLLQHFACRICCCLLLFNILTSNVICTCYG